MRERIENMMRSNAPLIIECCPPAAIERSKMLINARDVRASIERIISMISSYESDENTSCIFRGSISLTPDYAEIKRIELYART